MGNKLLETLLQFHKLAFINKILRVMVKYTQNVGCGRKLAVFSSMPVRKLSLRKRQSLKY
jgi:hypothetical protein